ncbi:DUF3299 domain-containing protein [Alkalilimnicola ehrlichii MLHE-1]|uniref:Lipoprotein n=1 Tax=Alkalilimnicola ehrlichii (strain ATCC BAA-1101 / DSM 17681 / MLHE-1) TaxID=187272 RepID=Q0A9E0_ALKEH|nr:DUF3299 domain-containing protein [Alkalilimnicola ehrlichii]ABI56547.1 hypothetical protein Mlg_1198 [Alkalilimnicola ehrlichii MLHE-1]
MPRTMAGKVLAVALMAVLALVGCADDSRDGAGKPRISAYLDGNLELGEVEALSLDAGDQVHLAFRFTDADGAPVAGERLAVLSRAGNLITHPAPRTDADGFARTRLLAQRGGQDTLEISGPGEARGELRLRVGGEEADQHGDHQVGEGELPERDDVLSWRRLGALKTWEEEDLLAAEFPDDILALEGQTVRVQGFMMPLEQGDRQRHFLLSASTPSCFYCAPGGPESVVEVKTDRGLAFTFDALTLEGELELLDPNEMGMFYRLKDARPAD